MPFCHLRLVEVKPENDGYLWKANRYPAHRGHIGEQSKKHRFDLKMTAVECRSILGVDKATLTDWELGGHEPSAENLKKIAQFLKTRRTCKGVALRETSTNGPKKKKHTEKAPRFGGESHHDNPINPTVKW